MFQEFIAKVCEELAISPVPAPDEKKVIKIPMVADLVVEFSWLFPGFKLFCRICPCPKIRQEELFLKIMRANYLGQQTGKARLGLTQDELFLTLSLAMPYEIDYQTFRDLLEDFVNFALHWKETIEKFTAQEALF